MPLGYCVYCGFNLSDIDGYKYLDSKIIDGTEWIEWLEKNLLSLFRSFKNTDYDYSKKNFCMSIRKILDKASNGNALKLEHKIGFGNGTITQWRSGRNKPRFDYLLVFAFRLGIDILDIINFERYGKCDINIKANSTYSNTILNTSKPKVHEHEKIELKLNKIIEKNTVTSISMLIKELDVSHGYLNYRFPKQIRLISSNYKIYLKNIKDDKFKIAANLIRQATINLHNKGIYPSRRKVFIETNSNSSEIYLSFNYNKVWKDQLLELGYKLS